MKTSWKCRAPVVWGLAGLTALTAVRLWIAAVTPLAPDEAYYWVWSGALAAGYLDHPPMVALWIWAGTMVAGSGEIGIRLLGPLSAALGSVLLYDTAERLFPGRRAGLTAAVLLNATLAVGIGSVIMTPDAPLMLFWVATLWAGARLATGGAPAWWLAAGAFAGLALASKYTAAFLPIGLGLYALIVAPRSLRRAEPWLGAVVGGLIFLPVVLWNAGHGWAGFLRQGGRVYDWRPERALTNLVELVGGQIGLVTPGVLILFAAGIAVAVRQTMKSRDPAWCLLAALLVPGTVVFVEHAIGGRVQGNWPAILYPAAAVAAAGLASSLWRRLMLPSVGLGLVITAIVYAHVVAGWPPTVLVKRDPVARQLFGWNSLAAGADAARLEAGAAFIAAEPYGLAAELAWGLPDGDVAVGSGNHWETFALPRAYTGDARGILVRPEGYGLPDPRDWRDWTRVASIARSTGVVELERYSVFLVRAADAPPRAVSLPRP
jgi:4-amino-4-deoxy-L-arabinose transferase-like glycosyltransferase